MRDASRIRALLRNHNYIILTSGQWVSQIGNVLFLLAGMWFVLSKTHSTAALGLYGMWEGVAGVLGLGAGVLADRWDRRRTMIASDGIRASVCLVVGGLALAGQLNFPEIALGTFLLGMVGSLFGPAQTGLLPQVVTREEVPAAVGMAQSATSSAQLVGNGVGGLLLAALGPATLMLINGASFVLSVLSLWLLRLSPSEGNRPAVGSSGFGTLWQDFSLGQRWIWTHPLLRRLVPLGVLANFAMAPFLVLDVAWVRQVLHQGSVVYGLFGTSVLAGMILGGLFAANLFGRLSLSRAVAFCLGLAGLSVGVFSRLPAAAPDLGTTVPRGTSSRCCIPDLNRCGWNRLCRYVGSHA